MGGAACTHRCRPRLSRPCLQHAANSAGPMLSSAGRRRSPISVTASARFAVKAPTPTTPNDRTADNMALCIASSSKCMPASIGGGPHRALWAAVIAQVVLSLLSRRSRCCRTWRGTSGKNAEYDRTGEAECGHSHHQTNVHADVPLIPHHEQCYQTNEDGFNQNAARNLHSDSDGVEQIPAYMWVLCTSYI